MQPAVSCTLTRFFDIPKIGNGHFQIFEAGEVHSKISTG
jgi:hypothetical protein